MSDSEKKDEPIKYNLLFLNDDDLRVDFLISVLGNVFRMKPDQIIRAVETIRQDGRMIVAEGLTREIAETKQRAIELQFRNCGEPLRVVMEPVS